MEDASNRKRGRPSGKNRVPLSAEERRARNALYERERRKENAEAMAELADSIGGDPGTSQKELILQVITYLKRNQNLQTLRSTNQNLMQEIAQLEQQLGNKNKKS